MTYVARDWTTLGTFRKVKTYINLKNNGDYLYNQVWSKLKGNKTNTLAENYHL